MSSDVVTLPLPILYKRVEVYRYSRRYGIGPRRRRVVEMWVPRGYTADEFAHITEALTAAPEKA